MKSLHLIVIPGSWKENSKELRTERVTAARWWARKLQAFAPAMKTLNKQLESSENDFIGILKNKGLQQPRERPIKKKTNLKR